MPCRKLSPKIIFRENESVWIIRGGTTYRRTGCGIDDAQEAQEALSECTGITGCTFLGIHVETPKDTPSISDRAIAAMLGGQKLSNRSQAKASQCRFTICRLGPATPAILLFCYSAILLFCYSMRMRFEGSKPRQFFAHPLIRSNQKPLIYPILWI